MILPVKVCTRILAFVLFITKCFTCVGSSSLNKISPALALLPWALNNTSQIEIRGDEGCYSWKLDSYENIKIINNVVRIDPQGNECVDSITVRPLWQYEYIKGIFMIRAHDIYSNEYFRSEVHVARIESIDITTSSKRIRVGSLEALSAIGYDREMNTFSSLDGLEIIWKLENNHIISEKNEGTQITVLGSSVGSTIVNVYIIGKEFDSYKLNSKVVIYVEDPFRIIPHTRRFPFGSEYEIKLLREAIPMSKENIYDKRYHKCEIMNSGQIAQIYDNKILINAFNGDNLYDEKLVNITCSDERVEGCFSSSIIYISFPTTIKFAIHKDKPIIGGSYVDFYEFVDSYHKEGGEPNSFGIFDITLEKDEINIIKGRTFFFQIKLLDYNQNYLSVPINSVFKFVCKIGCDLFNIISIPHGNKDNQLHGGFFQFEANSTGSSELSLELISIGDMIYSDPEETSNSKNIQVTLNINVVDELKINLHLLPIILYPGGEEINLYDYISGGKGPFYFCSKDISIVNLNSTSGIITTQHIAGEVEIIVYDIGVIMQLNEIDNSIDCNDLDIKDGLIIPLIVSYVDRMEFASISNDVVVQNNTIYTSILRDSIKLYFVPIWESLSKISTFYQESQYKTNNLYSRRLNTLDVINLKDPCLILKTIYNHEAFINEQFIDDETTELCVEKLNGLHTKSFVNLIDSYDKRIVLIDLIYQEILIKLIGPANIYLEDFLEFGVEFVVGSNKYKQIIFTSNLNINIFGDLKFRPIIERGILGYYKSLGVDESEFFVEESSSIVINLEGDIENDTSLVTNVVYDKENLIGEPDELTSEDGSHNSIQIKKLNDDKNMFLIQCVGEAFEIYNFIVNFYEGATQVFSIEIKVKVFCRKVEYVNVFWFNEFPLIGKYTCNSRNENCYAFHFNSKMIHRFVALSYDSGDNMLLSYNNYKMSWNISNIKEYDITYFDRNETMGSYIVDVMVHLDKDSIIRDVDLLFEAVSPPCSGDSKFCNHILKFNVSTKGIFVRPPVLISPNMVINDHDNPMNYHVNSKDLKRDDSIYDLGTWNMIEGEHQLGVIHGTNNYNVYLNDGRIINYSLCSDYLTEKNSKNNNILRNVLSDLNTFLFCLDSNSFSNDEHSGSVIIYIEDRLMLPRLITRKELVFSRLGGSELIWIDRFVPYEYQYVGSNFSGISYSFFSDTDEGFETINIPYQYIWLLELNKYFHVFNNSKENNIPCLYKSLCITNNRVNTFLILLLTNIKGEIMEPWQNKVRVDILYDIENFHNRENGLENLISTDTNIFDEIKVTNILYSVLFHIEEIILYDINVKFRAKIFDAYSNNIIFSNFLDLKVYDSIELESGMNEIFLFPFGYPLHLSFTGGPVGYNIGDLEFQWYMYFEEDSKKENDYNAISRYNTLLIRNNNQLILEPLGIIGNATVRIEYFLSKRKGENVVFKSLLYSTNINVFVDVPNEIDIFSPDQKFTYVGHSKVYMIKARKKDSKIRYFHNSQFIPSLLTQCNIKWSIQTVDEHDDKNIGCISLLNDNLVEYYDFKYKYQYNKCNTNIYSMKDYSISFYSIKAAEFELSVELNCSFGKENSIQLTHSQKINSIEEINGIEKTIFLVNNTVYHIKLQNYIDIENDGQFNLLYVNNSQFMHLDTGKRSSFTIKTIEKRFMQENFPIITLIPIVPTEPRMSVIRVSKHKFKTLSISILLMNSMGILIYPNINYCRKLRVNISSFHNDHNIINSIVARIINPNEKPNSSFESIGSLMGLCQFLIEFKYEDLLLKSISNKPLSIDYGNVKDNLKPFSIKSSCFIIQISSENRAIIGSQSFCYPLNYKLSNSNNMIYHKYDGEKEQLIKNGKKGLNTYNMDVLSGSIIHLNPLKWRIMNLVPERLTFCVFLKELVNKSTIVEELANITNIPRSVISFQHSDFYSRIRELQNEPENVSFTCIDINKRVDPFELWELLMRNISSISKPSGIFWVDYSKGLLDSNIEYEKDKISLYNWELKTSINNVEITEDGILFIPFGINSPQNIKLLLSDSVVNINVVGNSGGVLENIGFVKTNNDKFLLNMPFSFSVYSENLESKVFTSPFFSNIYYSPPIRNISCKISDPLLSDIYYSRTFWDIAVYKWHYLAPSCEIYPRNNTLPDDAINRVVNSVFDLRYLYIKTSLRNESFEMEFINPKNLSIISSNSSLLVHFHPIFLKQRSSIHFSYNTIDQYWDSDSSFKIRIVISKNSSKFSNFKNSLNIHFWFGYFDTQLTAFSIKSKGSEKYFVQFTPDNIQGVIQISKDSDSTLTNSIEQSQIQSSPNISLEFLSNMQKHYVQILFVDKENMETEDSSPNFHYYILCIMSVIRRNLFFLLTSLILLSLSILHLRLDRKCEENTKNSPFRKLNSRSQQVSVSYKKVM
ncbi:hypothetical protein FG386_003662 [Cryptosporidium ryanae]|uniref:uncharacterized protein n=1 Tax=Cryptosporidium ryanae TaxID=515981 RepID=UPI00351A340A|nr:hypothetical protein FG386_003662 [Cryptosporidium ryanae]